MTQTTHAYTNRLIDETSPYLLQHAHNPVEWYPWSDEALQRASDENKLILLSIGYSSCHWCHVMERESFENEAIAAIMNRNFVNIKIDREERPDLDEIYMTATMAMNHGQGGWPMTVFLTPDLEPVFAGTYFPPDDTHGRPGFPTVLRRIAGAWQQDPSDMQRHAAQVAQVLREQKSELGPALAVGEDELRAALEDYARDFDELYGGFGQAPKFPPATSILLLFRLHRRFGDANALAMASKTLDAMARGGIYDHVGGGFCRYATDRHWLVPHFEKMLYDNALLVRAYLEGFQITGSEEYRRVATETLDYVLREMTAGDGAFYSATDADSEGVEGKFFVWRPEEIDEILGESDAKLFKAYYSITDDGNWEGTNIPNTPRPLEDVAKQFHVSPSELRDRLERARRQVYDARATRVHPGLDDKILTAWNGLMIGAFAEGYRVLGETRYRAAAERAAQFIEDQLTNEEGGLLRTWRNGTARFPAYLEDYAYLAEGLVDLYEATGRASYLQRVEELARRITRDFSDTEGGAFYSTTEAHGTPIMRYRDGTDGATPAPNAVAASALSRLAAHTGRGEYRSAAARALKAYGQMITQFPRGFAKSLIAVDFLLSPPLEIVVAGREDSTDRRALERVLADHFLPDRIQVSFDPHGDGAGDRPLLIGKSMVNGTAALYVCRDFTCQAPVTDPDQVASALAATPQGAERSATIAERRPGACTAEATASYASRHDHPYGYRMLEGTDVTVSRLGFGGYRVEDVTRTHREALLRALMSGINLIDTSTNYMDGGSERLVGSVMSELIDQGEIVRAELVIASKIGYVQGANYDMAQEREAVDAGFPEMVKLEEGLWHCIHPQYLADQLERALDRLELETLDVCLLHNPEYNLSKAAADGTPIDRARGEFYRRVTEAFRFLEQQAAEGRIRWYGVSSNSVVSPAHSPDAVSASRLLEAAREAGGAHHRFRVLQLPMNAFESGAFLIKNAGDDHAQTALDVARANDLAVLVNRPLNAFTGRRMIRLAEVTVEGDAIDFDAQLAHVREMEERFRAHIAPDIQVPEGGADPAKFFTWSGQIAPLRGQPLTLEQCAHVTMQVQYGVARIAHILDQQLPPELAKRWEAWRDTYFSELGKLLGELRRQAGQRSLEDTRRIARAIDPLIPEQRRQESLSRKALWITASTPGVTSVLNGMRTPEYVRDAVGVMDWPALDNVAAVYDAASGLTLEG